MTPYTQWGQNRNPQDKVLKNKTTVSLTTSNAKTKQIPQLNEMCLNTSKLKPATVFCHEHILAPIHTQCIIFWDLVLTSMAPRWINVSNSLLWGSSINRNICLCRLWSQTSWFETWAVPLTHYVTLGSYLASQCLIFFVKMGQKENLLWRVFVKIKWDKSYKMFRKMVHNTYS